MFFWIVPKLADETYLDSEGSPIVAKNEPVMRWTMYKQWGSLHKAILWHESPPPATKEQPDV